MLPWRYGENVIWQELPVYRSRRFSSPFDMPGDLCWHFLRGGDFCGDGCREGFCVWHPTFFFLQTSPRDREPDRYCHVVIISFSSKSFHAVWISSIGPILSKSMYCACLAGVFGQSSWATPEYDHSPCLFLFSSPLDDPRDWSRRKQDKTAQTLLVQFVYIRLI